MTATPSAPPASPQPLIPPEETIWEKYSSNGEPLLSGLASFTLHGAVLGIIVMGLWAAFREPPAPPPIIVWEPEPLFDGDGDPASGFGHRDANSTKPGVPPVGTDVTKPLDPGNKNFMSDELPKNDPNIRPGPKSVLPDNETGQMIESKLARKPNLAPLGPALRDAASALSGSGLRGNGNDGGWGNADTKGGVGKQKGPGTPKSDRVKRMERWELVFTTNSAAHYLQQLDALGAVVAVPDRRGRLMTIRNWRERPVQLELLDVTGMNRIWWVDDRRETTESVAEELGLDIVPSALVAFFLRPFEDQLAAAERAFAGRAENQIALTRFAITFRNGKHVIRVIEQKGK